MACWQACSSALRCPEEHQRNADQLLKAGQYAKAMLECRQGMAAVANPHKRDAMFQPLMDHIAVQAAANGQPSVGFSGRHLVVRPADPQDAWLGLPAPAEPDEQLHGSYPMLDSPLVPPPLRPSGAHALPGSAELADSAKSLPEVGAAEHWQKQQQQQRAVARGQQLNLDRDPQRPSAGLAGLLHRISSGGSSSSSGPSQRAGQRPLTFRSLEDALAVADDDDVITLLPGTHNVRSSGGLAIRRRVLIRGASGCDANVHGGGGSRQQLDVGGAGQGGGRANCGGVPKGCEDGGAAAPEVVVDYRGNSPLFRISRSCVLQGFDIDMVGFAPCIFISGPQTLAPLLSDLKVSCSGDDAVDVGALAQPLLNDCLLTGRKVALRLFENSRAVLCRCIVESCGNQGILLQESSAAAIHDCIIKDCQSEGLCLSGSSHAELRGTAVTNCQGPAVDASGGADVHLYDCQLAGCVGGLWLWDKAGAKAERTLIASDISFAVMLDVEAAAMSGGSNIINGQVLVAEPGAPALRSRGEAIGKLHARSPSIKVAAAKQAAKVAAAAAMEVTGGGVVAAAAPAAASGLTKAASGQLPEGRQDDGGLEADARVGFACLVQPHMLPQDAKSLLAAFPPDREPFVLKPSQLL